MNITLPDNSVRSFDDSATAADVAASIGEGLAKAALGAKVNGKLVDLSRPLADLAEGDSSPVHLAIVTGPRINKKGEANWRDGTPDADALYLLRHSTAHVMAEAICKLYPKTQLAYGPPLDNGFYYDIALDTPISSADFSRIEAEMKRIVEEDRPFTRYELDRDTGMGKLYDERNKYKIDNADRALDGGAERLSFYVTGPLAAEPDEGCFFEKAPKVSNFEDLCMGPHVPSTGRIGAFKIMSVATSHWHGDVESDRFQRIYGTAFFTQAELDAHLAQLEEAKQRDHRVVGQRHGLFTIDEKVGQGLILWKPAGAIIRQELQNFILMHLERQGYYQVFTPHIGRLDLFKTSGHFPYYQDSQYPPLILREQLSTLAKESCSCAELAHKMEKGDIDGYLLKPMNCPFHIQIFASEKRSYRDLPIRLAEFGTVYRWEQSGELSGMTRVRGFTQDDAHLFVTEDQLDAEVAGCLDLVKAVFTTLGMTDYRVRVGLRDPASDKFVGDPEQWDKAGESCRKAAASLGVPFTAEEGEAAFYGPKIDFVVKDVIGRDWQLGTVQVDYVLPQRFNLEYTGPDNQPHRPVMIHRAPFGSMERFIGVLIEHFNASFPLWLSPQQVRVLPISDKFLDYAHNVASQLKQAGFRVVVDRSNDRLNAKIATAQQDKVPYMLIVGGKDQEAGTVSVRHRSEGDRGAVPLAQFIADLKLERDERRL